MTSREFCYWLQGYFELTDPSRNGYAMSVEQVDAIKKHLALVFVHEIDPSYPDGEKLDAIHNPFGPPKKASGGGSGTPRC
jgi:hypothetical protein